MGRFALSFVFLAVIAACGTSSDVPGTSEPAATSTTSAEATTTSSVPVAPTTTTAPRTTTVPPTTAVWTVAASGRNPGQSPESSAAVGSGCSPGTDLLPDGVWFGWVTDFGTDQVDFDLACLWPGRLEPAAGNDASRVRPVPVTTDTLIYLGGADPVRYGDWSPRGAATAAVNAPGLPGTLPFWLFVNSGVVTELAEYPNPVDWARSASAWPGLIAGCCGDGTVVPASPSDPWPEEGWPADGFYAISVDDETETSYDLTLARWLSCRDHPGVCLEFWVGDEVFTDPDLPTLRRTLPLDEDLTVVIMPISRLSEAAIVGDGVAFRDLLSDLDDAVAEWHPDDLWSSSSELLNGTDPDFPFEIAVYRSGEPAAVGYRGPGGSLLVTWDFWHGLEIRDRRPVLYVDAGATAG